MRKIHPELLSATANRLVTEMIPVSPFRRVLNAGAWGFQACWAIPPADLRCADLTLLLAGSIEQFCERFNTRKNGFEVQFVSVLVFCPDLIVLSTSDPTRVEPVRGWILQGFGVFSKSPNGTGEEGHRAQLADARELTGKDIPGVLASAMDVFCLHPSRN